MSEQDLLTSQTHVEGPFPEVSALVDKDTGNLVYCGKVVKRGSPLFNLLGKLISQPMSEAELDNIVISRTGERGELGPAPALPGIGSQRNLAEEEQEN